MTCNRLNLKAPTHRPDSNQQPAVFIRPLHCLSSDPFGRKVALKHTTSTAANYIIECMFCAYTISGGASLVPVIKNMKWQSGVHRKTKRTQYSAPATPHWFTSTPPVRMVIQLAYNQSEYPMAQKANSQCSQTSHVELEPTLSTRS